MRMPATAESKPAAQSIVATLGGFKLPLEVDRPHVLGGSGRRSLTFRFGFREVPFVCRVERTDGRPLLRLAGDLGPLPYTAAGPDRRRLMQSVLAAAQRRSGLDWEVTPQQQIVVRGGICLDLPLTPVAMMAGAVTLLLRARPFLDRLLEALGQES
jgi:hypothetical protein